MTASEVFLVPKHSFKQQKQFETLDWIKIFCWEAARGFSSHKKKEAVY